MSHPGTVAAPTPHVAHEAHHEELGFWRKYIFSTDHKVIGIQYAVTGLLFLLFGFSLMMLMRWQLAYPGAALPLIGGLFGEARMPGGTMLPEFYNELGAMHGTIMVFLGVVPLAVGGFGNFVLPLQIGAPDMAFPKINMASYWCLFLGGVTMLASFFVPGGAAQSGWTSYTPLAVIAGTGQTMWLIGMIFLITSSLLGAVNFITTTIQLRAKGLTFMRFPFFVWAQFVTAFLLLLAFPPLEAAGFMQLMDRVAGTSFFLPSGLVVSGQVLDVAGGGNTVLWQHLFWFLAHPEVYVLILPAMGIVAEIIANNTRKPLWGYRSMVYSLVFLGFMSFIVWAHHMFMTGMGTAMAAFFQTTTMIISIPSVVILTALIISLWGGSIRFNTPMLFAARLSPDVRHRRAHGASARLQHRGHPAARHVLRHRPLPLRRRSGDDLRPLRGDLLLVSEGDRAEDERDARQDPLFRLVRLHERRLHADVPRGAGRRLAPPVRRWGGLRLCAADLALERRLVVGRVDHRDLPDSLHLQFLLEHLEGGEDRGEPVAGHDDRVGGSLASAAWQFRRRPRRRTAGPTSTAFPARPRTSRRSTRPDSRWTFPTP